MKLLIRFYACALLCVIGNLQAEEIAFAHIATTGYGEVTVTPDCASFSVQVEQATMNADQAKPGVDMVVSKFIERLQKMGVSTQNITSSNLFLAPQYYYPKDGHPQLVGYRASRRVNVEVDDLSLLNQYLDIAIAEGINRVDDIQLKVKDQHRYLLEARAAAIADANQKAQSLALGFKRSLGAIWEIGYHTNSTGSSVMKTVSMHQKMANESYQDSSIVISDSVDVVYRLN